MADPKPQTPGTPGTPTTPGSDSASPAGNPARRPPTPPPPALDERGAAGQTSDTRLYFQLLVFTGCDDPAGVVEYAQRHAATSFVIYEAVNDPFGVGLLTFSREPHDFIRHTRKLIHDGPLRGCPPVPAMTMLGRSYALGYEPDLHDTLIERPTRHALNPETPWAVWYPLRRKGLFEKLPREEQNAILKQHGTIGFSFGRHGHAADIRLACHGLDVRDNDFVIGLMAPELTPLSKLVQAMRQTDQTSTYLEQLGPFFVGRALYQSPMP
ncbi:MAG: chlorite dismutase family protein [Planctomycetota bacterium]